MVFDAVVFGFGAPSFSAGVDLGRATQDRGAVDELGAAAAMRVAL